jgi:nucleotide-binding universal stress UspA family protein
MRPGSSEIVVVPGGGTSTELERVVHEVQRVFGGHASWLEGDAAERPHGVAAAEVSAGEVLRRAGEPGVTAVVLPVGSSPSTRFWEVARKSSLPVVGVPLGARCRAWRQVLLPLDGTVDSSRAVARVIPHLGAAGARLAAVHVVAPASYPEFCDQVAHHAPAWDDEFLRRHLPEGNALEIRHGVPADQVAAELESSGADVVVLGWSQSLDPFRAAVVRSMVLGPVPVLLLCTDGTTT